MQPCEKSPPSRGEKFQHIDTVRDDKPSAMRRKLIDLLGSHALLAFTASGTVSVCLTIRWGTSACYVMLAPC